MLGIEDLREFERDWKLERQICKECIKLWIIKWENLKGISKGRRYLDVIKKF